MISVAMAAFAFSGASLVFLPNFATADSVAHDDQSKSRVSSISSADLRCTALSQFELPEAEIVCASVQPANTPVITIDVGDLCETRNPDSVTAQSTFCRVTGRIRPEPGSDIKFEVWLPLVGWNGRFMGVGNGGFAGSIRYTDLSNAVKAGYATASTDTGHDEKISPLASWAPGNPQMLRDYGWRAIHLMTESAKRLVTAFFGRRADKPYFQSCSNGGRQGLMEASRFPNDCDGILAGAPAAQITTTEMSMVWVQQVPARPGAAFRPEQMALLQNAILKQCDTLDGPEDGLVDDPRVCNLDVSGLSCDNSSSPNCFSAPQVDALGQLYAGPPRSNGRAVAFAFPPSGAEVGRPVPFLGWDGYLVAGGQRPPEQAKFGGGVLRDFMAQPSATIEGFDWETDPAKLTAALGGVLDVEPDLTRYFARGGKLIIYHGWADAAIPPQQTINFYNSILKQSGPKASSSIRLFMIPGMQHCFGGTGAELFGEMSPAGEGARPEDNISMALRLWVEAGRVPDSVIGTSSPPTDPSESYREVQRLHCAFSNRSVLTRGANPDKWESYKCQAN